MSTSCIISFHTYGEVLPIEHSDFHIVLACVAILQKIDVGLVFSFNQLTSLLSLCCSLVADNKVALITLVEYLEEYVRT